MKSKYTKSDMSHALEMIFGGKSQQAANIATGVPVRAICDRMLELTCHHPQCSETNPCRSSYRRKNGLMCCTLLEATDFDDVCPFFSTEIEYHKEFNQTNKLSILEMKERGYL